MSHVPHQKKTCQLFKAWALKKGVEHLKKGRIKDHIVAFEQETGMRITYGPAHKLIAHLVHQSRKARNKEPKALVFVLLRPDLRARL